MQSAKNHKIILSEILEKALKKELKKKAEESWIEENKSNLDRYNKRINDDGVFSDELRTF